MSIKARQGCKRPSDKEFAKAIIKMQDNIVQSFKKAVKQWRTK